MLKRTALVCAAVTTFTAATSASAGPFGFSKAFNPAEVSTCIKGESAGFYKCETAPRSHSSMDFYALKYHPDHGVCFIKAVGKDISTSRFGHEVRSEWNEINEQIASKYGEEKVKVDEVLPGALWDEPEDYMMSLIKKERIAYTKWEASGQDTDGIEEIFTAVMPLSTDSGYVTVEFYLDNKDACDETLNAADADAF